MIVVANASVLIGLSAIDRLSLLQARFPDGIVIPDAVWREVVEAGGSRPGAHAVRIAPWIRRQAPGNPAWVRLLRMELDEGEAEAIVLASELGAGVVLLDERDARRLAERIGLRVLGTVGVLVWANLCESASSADNLLVPGSQAVSCPRNFRLPTEAL